MMLLRNQVLTHVASETTVRVLEINVKHAVAWLFNLSHPKALPRAYPLEDVENSLSEGLFVEYDADTAIAPRNHSEAAVQRRNKAYAAIEPLIQNPDILDADTRAPLIRARARELKCSEQTLRKYLRSWWHGGQSKQCLTPGFHRIGSTKGSTRGRGRPPIYGDTTIYQIEERDRTWMKEVIETEFLRDKTVTALDAYESLLTKHYSYIDGNGKRCLNAPGDCPSEAQFRYYLNQTISKERQIRARHGDAEFELKYRPIIGSLRASTYTVAQYYEIDATKVDVVLVHEADRATIIGKPTLYTIIDRKCGMVIGLYVGLENPSWTAARLAIKFIAEDKEAICRQFDIPYDPEDWPAHRCFPHEFIADLGSEMKGNTCTQVADNLEINVRNLPTRRADWKPHVECGFKQIQRSLATLPGYIPPEDFGKRQKHDRTAEAALTLKEFIRTVLMKIIQKNKTPLSNNPMLPKHMLKRILPTPINIWNTEIRERAGLPTMYSEAQVRFALLPQDEASITREGIVFKGCTYDAPEALKYGWFVQASQGRFKKTISYDKRFVDTIFIHDETHPQGYFIATLSERCKHYAGLSFDEVAALNFEKQEIAKEGKRLTRQLNVDFKADNKPVVALAIRQTKEATKGKSRSSRKKHTVEARLDSLRIERQESTPTNAATKSPPQSAEVIALTHQNTTVQPPKSRKELFKDLIDGK